MVRLTPADVADIAALAERVWRDHYPGIISSSQIDYMLRRMYDPEVLRNDMASRVAYDGLRSAGGLIAFVAYEAHAMLAEMKLHKLYIDTAWQRLGLGSRLLAHVEAEARAAQLERVVLTVNKANSVALAAYHKNGYVIRDRVVVDIGEGFVMDDFIMTKAAR